MNGPRFMAGFIAMVAGGVLLAVTILLLIESGRRGC